jgi:hypothetical protein
MFEKFVNWLTLRDYEREKEAAFRGVVSRFTRGNIAIQDGRFLTASELAELGRAGDIAAAELRQLSLH